MVSQPGSEQPDDWSLHAATVPLSPAPTPPAGQLSCLDKSLAHQKLSPACYGSRSHCALPAGGRQCQMRTGPRMQPSVTSSSATLT